MNQEAAVQAAAALGGEALRTGGNIWIVRIVRKHGLVVISDDMVGEYESQEEFDEGRMLNVIELV